MIKSFPGNAQQADKVGRINKWKNSREDHWFAQPALELTNKKETRKKERREEKNW